MGITRSSKTAIALATVVGLLLIGSDVAGSAALRPCDDVVLERGADLRRCDLSGATLNQYDLRDTDLRHADLTDARVGANPDGQPRLDGADLRHVDAVGSDMSDLYIIGADLRHADFTDASFETSYLADVDASKARLDGMFFSAVVDSTLRHSKLLYLEGAYFSGVDLRNADFSEAEVREVRFADSDLRHATGLASAADIETVTWTRSICPDGTDSERNGGTCLGHLM